MWVDCHSLWTDQPTSWTASHSHFSLCLCESKVLFFWMVEALSPLKCIFLVVPVLFVCCCIQVLSLLSYNYNISDVTCEQGHSATLSSLYYVSTLFVLSISSHTAAKPREPQKCSHLFQPIAAWSSLLTRFTQHHLIAWRWLYVCAPAGPSISPCDWCVAKVSAPEQ